MTTTMTMDQQVNHYAALALHIGEASSATYAQIFTRDELIDLWQTHCVYRRDEAGELVEPDASYDDEVYDALNLYGYWDEQ